MISIRVRAVLVCPGRTLITPGKTYRVGWLANIATTIAAGCCGTEDSRRNISRFRQVRALCCAFACESGQRRIRDQRKPL